MSPTSAMRSWEQPRATEDPMSISTTTQEPSAAFQRLQTFLKSQMRMAHLYQPLMLKALIEKGGVASLRDIASSFLAHDESQIEYYTEITKRMPGPVLTRHQLVRRDGEGYRLLPNVEELSAEERDELLRLCDEAVANYTGRRGRKLYDHRRWAIGDISGTVRYEVLKRAGHRCELCGIPADERWLEVDHILPRRHGGTDDISNLQALCYKCNANKGARDDSDLRAVRARMSDRAADCVFCSPGDRLSTSCSISSDKMFSVLIRAVDGFNIGMNCGETAGQTIMHCHVHLIPRRRGDVEQPRGGVRGVIPAKQGY